MPNHHLPNNYDLIIIGAGISYSPLSLSLSLSLSLYPI